MPFQPRLKTILSLVPDDLIRFGGPLCVVVEGGFGQGAWKLRALGIRCPSVALLYAGRFGVRNSKTMKRRRLREVMKITYYLRRNQTNLNPKELNAMSIAAFAWSAVELLVGRWAMLDAKAACISKLLGVHSHSKK